MGTPALTRSAATGTAAADVVAIVAAMVAVTGCAGPAGDAVSGTPPVVSTSAAPASPPVASAGPPPTLVPTVPGYRYDDPADVCHRFAAALYSADTTVDSGPADAPRRAAGYADAALAATLTRSTVDGRWPLWRQHRARLHTQVRGHADSEAPVDSTVAAYRAVQVAATPVGDHGWRGWTQTTLLHCTLTPLTPAEASPAAVAPSPEAPGGGPWRVAGYTLAPLPGAP